ncbi:MAG: hypothetical protein AAGH89_03375 [Verrucomicrobiota bacterium]
MALHFGEEVPFSVLTRDPAAVADLRPYIGFMSQFGLFFWSAATTTCLLVARVLAKSESPDRPKIFFFLWSGGFTLLLGVDDAFMLHESVLPHIGIPELVVYGGYIGLFACYLYLFYKRILETDFILLLLAFAFFGLSVGLDIIELTSIDPYLLEDSAKLAGITCWMIYFIKLSVITLWSTRQEPEGLALSEPQ